MPTYIVCTTKQENGDDPALKAHLAEKDRQRRQKHSRLVRRAKRTPLHIALLNSFSSWNYGVTDGDSRRFAYKTTTVIGRYNNRRRSKTLCAADLENHWRNNDTLYYMGNGDPKQDRILLKLDFDAKDGVGSYQGCVQAEQYINAKYFKGKLFAEDSTHGNGRHAYFWLYKLGRNAEEVNAAIDRLQQRIRADLESVSADISGLDLQGTCPVIQWESIGGELCITQFVDGRLAKIPRTATTALLDAAEIMVEDVDRLVAEPATLPTATRTWAASKPRRQACYGGFMKDENFDDLDRLKKLYRRLISRFNGGELVKANRRYVVREEHAAIMFAIMRYAHENPHKNGTFPQDRAESLWNDAYNRGLIDCGWNHYRWTALRNFLTKNGFIDWEDNTYFHFYGEAKKGCACKWTVTAGFYGMLSECRDSYSTTQGGDLGIQRIVRGMGQALYPVMFQPKPGAINPNLFIRAAKAMEMLFAA